MEGLAEASEAQRTEEQGAWLSRFEEARKHIVEEVDNLKTLLQKQEAAIQSSLKQNSIGTWIAASAGLVGAGTTGFVLWKLTTSG
jgi:hypothetical protein